MMTTDDFKPWTPCVVFTNAKIRLIEVLVNPPLEGGGEVRVCVKLKVSSLGWVAINAGLLSQEVPVHAQWWPRPKDGCSQLAP